MLYYEMFPYAWAPVSWEICRHVNKYHIGSNHAAYSIHIEELVTKQGQDV